MPQVGTYDEDFLLQRAAGIVKDKTKDSTIFSEDAERLIPTFATSELTAGNILGKGGFCTVSEVRKVTLAESSSNGDSNAVRSAVAKSVPGAKLKTTRDDDDDGDDDDDDGYPIGFAGTGKMVVQDRAFIASKYLRQGKDARYAIKILSDDVLSDPNRFVAGVIDLAIESRFLAVVKHPNIIKMRATANSDPYSHGYFVVLDRLYDTLAKRFTIWKKTKTKLDGLGKIRDMKGKKKVALFLERILVAYDLAAALRYLHSKNIAYRDLKPDNIGFDVRGDVKIFDFGLAREIIPEEKVDDDLYKMSGNTGSLRYMAPEVALDKPYNLSVDAYSFGILLWQICYLETPFTGYTVTMHKERVIKGGVRPKIDPGLPPSLANLMRSCWSATISDRPSFQEITETLRNEVSDLRGDSDCVLDTSNRTAKSLQSA
mmetsp:Transcript_15764/g.34270  ORF Transcript_15764/g.34270 Transcript_15764/m.34270 type:complete len:429 (+) Transcript_15764:506-1792(+)